MKAIKKIGKVILVIIACVAFVLMGAETKDGGISLPWTLGWLAALAISARLLDRMGAFNNKTLYNDGRNQTIRKRGH